MRIVNGALDEGFVVANVTDQISGNYFLQLESGLIARYALMTWGLDGDGGHFVLSSY